MNGKDENSDFVQRVLPYCDAVVDETKSAPVLKGWLLNALSQYRESKRASSFAPFDAYFATQATFREAFSVFFKAEIEVLPIEGYDGKQIISNVIQVILKMSVDDVMSVASSPAGKQFILDDFVYEMFQLLLDLNSEAALDWASHAIRSPDGFSLTKSNSDVPSPIFLYLNCVSTDTSGPQSRSFFRALFDWCNANAHQTIVQPYAFDVLLLALRSESEPDRAIKQFNRLKSLFRPRSDQGKTLLAVIESQLDFENAMQRSDLTLDWARQLEDITEPEVMLEIAKVSDYEKELWRASPIFGFAFTESLSRKEDESVSALQFSYEGSMAEVFGIPPEVITEVRTQFRGFRVVR